MKKHDFSGAEFYFSRGNSNVERQEYRAAIDDFTRALILKPDLGVAFFHRGSAKRCLDDHLGAIFDYTKAIKLEPEDGEAYLHRGHAFLQLGQYAEACQDFMMAEELGECVDKESWNACR